MPENKKLEISAKGKEMLDFQNSLSIEWGYKKLPSDVSVEAHQRYYESLPNGMGRLLASVTTLSGKGLEIKDPSFKHHPVVSRCGTQIASGFERVVIGDYGAFLEIPFEFMKLDNIKVKPGEEYRLRDDYNVKHHWYTTKDASNCKLYFQQGPVTYADYRPSMWYISPYEAMTRKEMADFLEKLRKEEPTEMKKITKIKLKPEGYKTVSQWRKEGRIPASDDVIEEYAAVKNDGTPYLDENGNACLYKYVAPENTVPVFPKQDIPQISLVEGKKIVCFDTETTGTGKRDEILQITMCDGNGTELISTFVKPIHKKSWPGAAAVNGIYPSTVKNAPHAADIAPIVCKIVEEADVIVGHNIKAFDIPKVRDCLGASFEGKEIFDTLQIYRKEYPKEGHSLREAVIRYCPEALKDYDQDAHKSDTDVRANLAVYRAMMERQRSMTAGIDEELERE